ncbi:hypothetical protein V8G54_005588 [Vigna mungo]|uniref:Uncharacterized protein n=1 Tax=Vigna mungo TaxID=3915 RepID=A0AAQ3NXE8_VIGMU
MYIIIHITTNIHINKALHLVSISITTTTLRRGIPTSNFHIWFNFILFCTFIFTMTTNFLNFHFSINSSLCLFNSMTLFLHDSLNFYFLHDSHLFFFTTQLF